MSYYQALPSYYKNPGPIYGPGGDFGAPVPGWGVLPNMAGPAMIAVDGVGLGQVKRPSFRLPTGEVTDCMREVQANLKAYPEVHLLITGGAYKTSGVWPDLMPAKCIQKGGVAASRDAWQKYIGGTHDAYGKPIAGVAAAALPWWLWLAAPMAVGGGLLVAQQAGLFGE